MKSLRQLTDQLLNMRLQATNVSQWVAIASLQEAARVAINDAIATYEFAIQGVYTSLPRQPVIALPADIARVLRIEIVTDTRQPSSRKELRDWSHVPTAHTNLLYLNWDWWPAYAVRSPLIELFYEARQGELPPSLALASTLSDVSACVVTGGTPAAVWPRAGYFELSSPLTTTDVREVVRYEIVGPAGFSQLTRGVEGLRRVWAPGTVVSPVNEAPNESLTVLLQKAQAVMYELWVRDRALYNQYTAIASEQALSMMDLLGLARTWEDKAERTYARLRKPPLPTQFQTKY